MKFSLIVKASFWVLLIVSVSKGYGQHIESFKSDKKGMILIPNIHKGIIQLRWIPNSVEAWQEGANKGYNIYRTTVGEQFSLVKLNDKPIKPMDADAWRAIADTSKEMQQAILGVMVDSAMTATKNAEEAIADYQFEQMNFALAMIAANNSVLVANASGLYYEDKTVKPGKAYIYKIEVEGAKEEDFKPTIARIECCVDPVLFPPATDNSLFDEYTVKVKWSIPKSGMRYSYYDIYRSTKSGSNYIKVNSEPIIPNAANQTKDDLSISYQDSVPQTGLTYYYKVQGTTMFGHKSPFSKVMSGTCLRKLHTIPQVTSVKYTPDGKGAKIEWIIDGEDAKFVKNIQVFKAQAAIHSEFVNLTKRGLAPETRSFVDTDLWSANYYSIKMVGINGDSVASIPFFFQAKDSIPPAPPTGLSAKVDTSWIVRLSWKPNTEKDLHGYRVFKRTSVDGELIRLSVGSIKDTTWNDTLAADNAVDKYYYYISAVDLRYNASKFSKGLEVKIPSKNRPVAPLITKYITDDKGITITWVTSPTAEIVKDILYRKSELDTEWKQIYEFVYNGKREVSFRDTTTIPGKSYIYTLQAEAKSGWKSDYAQEVTVGHIDNKIRGNIENLKLIVSKEQRMIKVTWDYKPQGVKRYEIYKGQDNKQPVLLTSIIDGKTEYYDKDLKPGHKYTYKIRAVHHDGASSTMSAPQTVDY